MSRRSLLRGARFQPPDPQSIERYLRFFSSKELFWNPDIFSPIDSPHLFGDDLPLELEIGCGTADFLCAQALEHPGTNFVGVDVSVKPLFKAIRTAEVHALPNITFIKGDRSIKRAFVLAHAAQGRQSPCSLAALSAASRTSCDCPAMKSSSHASPKPPALASQCHLRASRGSALTPFPDA